MLNPASTIGQLLSTLPQTGTVTWIGIRPARRVKPIALDEVKVNPEIGLEGDHYASKTSSKRQVTLTNEEHLSAIASMLGKESITPDLLRRNIVVRGISIDLLIY